jgi:polyhydroxyalkanoate synthesis regulator phasin
MTWKQWLVAGLLAVSGFPGSAYASSEVGILVDKLVKKGVLSPQEADEVRSEVVETREARNKALAKEIVPQWARNWQWSGDIRLRSETRNLTDSPTVNRQRIRVRLGLDAKVTPHLKASARLATGSSTDPVATNQSFSTSFNRVSFLLEQAYLAYTPEVAGLDQFKLAGGLLPNPFWTVGQLVWDVDLNFHGAAASVGKEIGPADLFVNSGVFSLQTDITESASLWSLQGGAVLHPFTQFTAEVLNNFTLTGALAYYDYKNVTNPLTESTARTTAGGFKGNTTGVQDYNLLNPTLQVASQVDGVPWKLYGDWVHNTAVAAGGDGFQLGVAVGKAKKPFDLKEGWEAGYYFERLEPDATFGAFTSSDFGGGGTNHLGNVWWLKLATLKNSDLTLSYYAIREVKRPKSHEDRLQVDWLTKF